MLYVYICIADLPTDRQIEVLHEVLDDLQAPNRLLLSWLLRHMLNVIAKVHDCFNER